MRHLVVRRRDHERGNTELMAEVREHAAEIGLEVAVHDEGVAALLDHVGDERARDAHLVAPEGEGEEVVAFKEHTVSRLLGSGKVDLVDGCRR